MSKTVPFWTIQFSISTQFSSIWLIDRTLSGATTQARMNLETVAIKGYSAFPKAPALLELHHHMFSVISRTFGGEGGGSYPSAGKQLEYSTAPANWAIEDWSLTIRFYSVIIRTLFGRVLPLCRNAVGVFYSPSWLCKVTFVSIYEVKLSLTLGHMYLPNPSTIGRMWHKVSF